MVETSRPRATSRGTSLVTSVVLPAPLQPARPITRVMRLIPLSDPDPRAAGPTQSRGLRGGWESSEYSSRGGLHPEPANAFAHRRVLEGRHKCLHGRTRQAFFLDQEVVKLRADGRKTQFVKRGHALDSDAAIRSSLRDRRRDRVVRARLVAVTR